MTKKVWGVLLLVLLLAPMALAHGAPRPLAYQTRLLADCSDDVGADGGVSQGYDVHSLDIQEFWDGSDHRVEFRTILNGRGPATLTLSFSADKAHSYTWSTSDGTNWQGSGFDGASKKNDVFVNNDPSEPDGDRFSLTGHVLASSLGGIGSQLRDYTLAMDDNGFNDRVPGRDGLASSCLEPFERASYVLRGVDTYTTTQLKDAATGLAPNQGNFLDLQVATDLSNVDQLATLKLLSVSGEGDVRFHDSTASDGEGYSTTLTTSLGGKGELGSVRIIHLDVRGEGGESGTAQIEVRTDLGGRELVSVPYSIRAANAPEPSTSATGSSSSESQDAPVAPLALLLVGLVALARRRA